MIFGSAGRSNYKLLSVWAVLMLFVAPGGYAAILTMHVPRRPLDAKRTSVSEEKPQGTRRAPEANETTPRPLVYTPKLGKLEEGIPKLENTDPYYFAKIGIVVLFMVFVIFGTIIALFLE
jgi:hypothetical protein